MPYSKCALRLWDICDAAGWPGCQGQGSAAVAVWKTWSLGAKSLPVYQDDVRGNAVCLQLLCCLQGSCHTFCCVANWLLPQPKSEAGTYAVRDIAVLLPPQQGHFLTLRAPLQGTEQEQVAASHLDAAPGAEYPVECAVLQHTGHKCIAKRNRQPPGCRSRCRVS